MIARACGTSSPRCSAAPSLPCTQCTGHSTCSPYGSEIVSTDELDGVTVDLGGGRWFNLRTSNTEPLLRLNVESRTREEVDQIVEHIAAQIRASTP